jgi:hypothetical protein
MTGKRRFGRVRRLPSGRWQARYKGPDGIDCPAGCTFDSKADAERWLALMEAEIVRGARIDPDAGRVFFGNYAETWTGGARWPARQDGGALPLSAGASSGSGVRRDGGG